MESPERARTEADILEDLASDIRDLRGPIALAGFSRDTAAIVLMMASLTGAIEDLTDAVRGPDLNLSREPWEKPQE